MYYVYIGFKLVTERWRAYVLMIMSGHLDHFATAAIKKDYVLCHNFIGLLLYCFKFFSHC